VDTGDGRDPKGLEASLLDIRDEHHDAVREGKLNPDESEAEACKAGVDLNPPPVQTNKIR